MRPERAIVKLFFLIIFSLFCAGFYQLGLGQNEECKVKMETPIANATRAPKLKLKSGKGRNCVVYKVKNEKGGIFMPVSWKYKQSILLDCNVSKGPTDWNVFEKFSFRQDSGPTTFFYGPNKDTYEDMPIAYRDDPRQEGAFSLSTKIKGTFASLREINYEINLFVKSFFNEKERFIDFSFEKTSKSPDLFLPLVDLKNLKEKPSLSVLWKPAQNEIFKKATKNDRMVMAFKKDERKGRIKVRLKATKVSVKQDVLSIVVGKDSETILRVTAPYFWPKGKEE